LRHSEARWTKSRRRRPRRSKKRLSVLEKCCAGGGNVRDCGDVMGCCHAFLALGGHPFDGLGAEPEEQLVARKMSGWLMVSCCG